jgi:hypothetical protein
VQVHVYVDGSWGGAFAADHHRSDVGVAYPESGPAHGLDATVAVGGGASRVCVYAINIGLGATNPLMACHTV